MVDTADPTGAIPTAVALELLGRAGAVLTGARSLDDTMRHVVQLVVPAVADWCAVLLVAEHGDEREYTSRHPDPEVEAVLRDIRRRRRSGSGGGSESLDVLRTGEPILVSDIAPVADGLSGRDRAVITRLAPRSYLLVPLRARGRIVGVMTWLSTMPGRHYAPADLAFARTFAGRCALAIDNALLEEAAGRSLSLLDTVFDSAPVGLAFLDLEQRFVRVNEALAAMHGRPAGEHLGRTVAEVLGPAGEAIAHAHEHVVATGDALLERESSGSPAAGSDETRHWVSSFTPVRDPSGAVAGVTMATIDITERRRLLERQGALLAAERAARARADFLARAGALLDATLDLEQTLRTLAEIAVPEIADWCTIRMRDAEGRLAHVVTAHEDPADEAIAREYESRFAPDAEAGTAAVARRGVAEIVTDITDEMLEAGMSDPDQLALLRRIGMRSLIIAPLAAHRRVFGTITLVHARSGRRFAPDDVRFAEELARRAGVAIENARLYTERSRIAHALQARLLPGRLPEIPRARLAARYRAAGELNEVGGDFYDAFRGSGDEWAIVVGDVSGKGAEGAAVTALARYTLRAAARQEGPPSGALRVLNSAILDETGVAEFVTVALAYLSEAPGGGLRARLALGGHPPPLVLRADGRVEAPAALGAILGVVEDPLLPDTEIMLEPGDMLLLYTDGVTEAGPRSDPLGESGLEAIVAAHAGAGPEQLADAVERAAVAAEPDEPRDDIALLAVLVTA